MIIFFHFHFKTTGVTRSVESILEPLNVLEETKVFGYGISKHKISFYKLLRLLYSDKKTIVHTHRNNEMLLALILRFLGGRFNLLRTRHAESTPSGLTNFLMSKADQCISLSAMMAQNLKLKSTVAGHGVDPNWLTYDLKKRAINPRKISVVGRIRKAKGQRDVMEAIAPLLSQNPSWEIQFIGTIDRPAYADEIRAIAATAQVENQIQFVSQTNQIEHYYQESTAVVVASYSEGFSLVCLEAMACGSTTIATEQVGIHSEVITNGVDGFLYPKGSVAALRTILENVIRTPEKIDPNIARQTILDHWSVTAAAQKLFETYSKLRNGQ
jgi:mannosyltransferase